MAEDKATGGCLCGAVRYEIEGGLREVIGCHCGQCQRTHGNFAAYTATAKERLVFLDQRGLAWYQSSDTARRGFCRECGASLFWDPLPKDYIAVSAGSLDQPTGLKLTKHIFVEDKPDFYEITDGLPQYEASSFT